MTNVYKLLSVAIGGGLGLVLALLGTCVMPLLVDVSLTLPAPQVVKAPITEPAAYAIVDEADDPGEGCSVGQGWFEQKKDKLELIISYGMVNKGLWARMFTLYCQVTDVSDGYTHRGDESVTYRTIVGGLSNEGGGISIKWSKFYELGEEIQYKFYCACTSIPVMAVVRTITHYATVKP